MNRLIYRVALFALAIAAFAAAPASAAPINYNLTLTAITGSPGGTGSFSIDGDDYENSALENFTPGDANKTLLSLVFDIDGIHFDLSDALFAQVLFLDVVATNAHVLDIIYQGFDGGNFQISMNTGALTYIYTNLSNDRFSIGTISVALAPTAGVPEPMSLALLGTGLIGLGVARRRKAA